MQHRTVRFTILVLLLIVGVASASFLWYTQQRTASATSRTQHVDAVVSQMLADLTDLGLAQQAYLAAGQPDAPWERQVSSLTPSLADQGRELGASLGSAESIAKAQDVTR